jgi:hypothetical protein
VRCMNPRSEERVGGGDKVAVSGLELQGHGQISVNLSRFKGEAGCFGLLIQRLNRV